MSVAVRSETVKQLLSREMPFRSNLSDTDRGKTRGASKVGVRKEPMVFVFLTLEHLKKLPACAVYGTSVSPG